MAVGAAALTVPVAHAVAPAGVLMIKLPLDSTWRKEPGTRVIEGVESFADQTLVPGFAALIHCE